MFFSFILRADFLGLETVPDEQVNLTGRFNDGMANGFSVVFVSSEIT